LEDDPGIDDYCGFLVVFLFSDFQEKMDFGDLNVAFCVQFRPLTFFEMVSENGAYHHQDFGGYPIGQYQKSNNIIGYISLRYLHICWLSLPFST